MTEEFQTDGVFDVYKLLDVIRSRPAMYLGEESLTKLWLFLQGYQSALTDNDVPFREVGPFNRKFHYFVVKHFKDFPMGSRGYYTLIMKHCDNGDETKALAKFFELLDEFRRQEES